MQKKKMVIVLMIAAAVLTFFLVNYLGKNRGEYNARKECFNQASAGPDSDYKLPEGIDCSPYQAELEAAFPGRNF